MFATVTGNNDIYGGQDPIEELAKDYGQEIIVIEEAIRCEFVETTAA